jgi:hypothetical protein
MGQPKVGLYPKFAWMVHECGWWLEMLMKLTSDQRVCLLG